jgi:hypothetical protein
VAYGGTRRHGNAGDFPRGYEQRAQRTNGRPTAAYLGRDRAAYTAVTSVSPHLKVVGSVPRAPSTYYTTSRTLKAPSAPTHTPKGSAVVVIGVGRGPLIA